MNLNIAFKTLLNEKVESSFLLFCCVGEAFGDYGLLESNEGNLGLASGEKVFLLDDHGLITGNVGVPSIIQLSVKSRALLAVLDRVCLSLSESNHLS